MNRLITLLFLAMVPMLTFGQVRISGEVSSNGAPLQGASIYIEDSYDGAVSGPDGRFDFMTEESGMHTLVIEFLGFAPFRQELNLDKPVPPVFAELKEVYNELKAATISAGVFAAGEAHRTAVLKPLDIVTTAGSNGNVVGALQTLPGSTPVGESGRLFVRGGAADETQIYVDGMRVLQPYTSGVPQTQVRGRFNPFLFSGTQFSTGGYSVEFGNAMSAVLQLETDDPPAENQTNVSLMSVGGDVNTSRTWEGGGVLASLSYIHLGPTFAALPQNFNWYRAPQSAESVVRLGQETARGGNVRVLAQATLSTLEMGRASAELTGGEERISLNNRYGFASVAFTEPLSEKWMLDAGVSVNLNRDELGYEQVQIEQQHDGVFAKLKLTRVLAPGFKLRSGIAATAETYQENVLAGDAALRAQELQWMHPSVFSEIDGHLGNDWAWRVGVRGEYSTALEDWNLAPRASLTWQQSEASNWSVAAGRFFQSPHHDWLAAGGALQFSYADQALFNWQTRIEGRVIRLEAYAKKYRNLLTHQRDSLGLPIQIAADGFGYSWGLEGFVRDNKTIPNLDYWVSYSFLDAQRQYLDFPEQVTPGFASSHVVSVVCKYWVDHWRSQIGLTAQVAGARTFDNPNTPAFQDGKTDVYRTVDVNWSYLFRPQVIFHVSVSNLFGFENSFGSRFSSQPGDDGTYTSTPVLPASNRFVFVGCFITLSSDTSANQLDKL